MMYQIYRSCGTLTSYVHRRCLPSIHTFIGPYSYLGCKYFGDVKSAKQLPEFRDNKPIWRDRRGLKPSLRTERISKVAKKLHERWKFELPEAGNTPAVAGCFDVLHNGEVTSCNFKLCHEVVGKLNDQHSKVNLSGQLDAYFADKCEKISNSELTSLLHFLLESHKNKTRWSDQAKEVFYVLEREMCRRLHHCFQGETREKEDSLKFFEKNLHLMLEFEVGHKFFIAYIGYCQLYFTSAVSVYNIPFLLLSTIRVKNKSYVLFSRLEDFVLRNYDSLDINTLSFFCVSSVISSFPITSYQLLDRLGTTLMCHLQSAISDDVVNILKGLQFSAYNKVSFYRDLQLCMERNDTISKCGFNQLIHVLSAFKRARVSSDYLLKSSAERCKFLVKQNFRCQYRMKDFGVLADALGYFQYKDTSGSDIYTLCADRMVKYIKKIREPNKMDIMYLSSCAAGLLYAGMIHDKLFDVLFGIPNIWKFLHDVRRSELLLIDGTLRLQHPEYTGRLLELKTRANLHKAVAEDWNLDIEISRRNELKMAIDVLKSLVGEDNVKVEYILPHIKSADIILFLDGENRVVQPESSKRRVAVEVLGWKHYIQDTGMLLGKYALKQRQLKHLGYQIITAYPHEERSVLLHGTEAEQQEFWINKLKSRGIMLPLAKMV